MFVYRDCIFKYTVSNLIIQVKITIEFNKFLAKGKSNIQLSIQRYRRDKDCNILTEHFREWLSRFDSLNRNSNVADITIRSKCVVRFRRDTENIAGTLLWNTMYIYNVYIFMYKCIPLDRSVARRILSENIILHLHYTVK